MLFLVGAFATFEISRAIHGVQAYDGDAGAKFALFGEGLAVGAVVGLIGFLIGAIFFGPHFADCN